MKWSAAPNLEKALTGVKCWEIKLLGCCPNLNERSKDTQ